MARNHLPTAGTSRVDVMLDVKADMSGMHVKDCMTGWQGAAGIWAYRSNSQYAGMCCLYIATDYLVSKCPRLWMTGRCDLSTLGELGSRSF